MNGVLYGQLSVMMFLEYAIWGAWAPVLAAYLLGQMKLSGKQTGWVYATLWLACIVSPMIGGQIADRWISAQYLLAVVQVAGGVLLLIAAFQRGFWGMFLFMALYSLLYAATLPLTNSVMFIHKDAVGTPESWVRVWGTIGWIAAGLGLTFWRQSGKVLKNASDCLVLAGIMSLVMGVFSFLLPDTPPSNAPGNPFAFLEALNMLKDPMFLVFLVISFIVTTELQFYYVPTAQFLEDLGVKNKNVPATMTVAQVGEILGMAVLLPWCMTHLGIGWVLVLGVVAWPLRYVIFAIMKPLWLVITSLSFHGIGYTFFFFAGQVYVDMVAPEDIRASAQGLIFIVTLGLGNFIGTQFTGVILDVFKTPEGKFRWRPIFLIPCVLTVACAIAFILFFNPDIKEKPAETAAVPAQTTLEAPAQAPDEAPAQPAETAAAIAPPVVEEAATVGAPAQEAAAAAPAELSAAPADQQAVADQARALCLKMKTDLEAGNIEGVLALFADDFTHTEYGDKAGLSEFLNQAKDMGYLDDVGISTEGVEFKVEEGKVTVSPVELSGAFGSAVLDLVLETRNGAWQITGLEVSGI